MPDRSFPRLPFRTGDYAAEWFIGDRAIAGEFSAEPLRPPQVTLFDDVEQQDWSAGGSFPKDFEYERVVGRLRSGQDVVLTDAQISIWWIRRSHGSARHALVGLNIADVPDDAYARIRFQITDLDLLFGVAPIKSVSWPAETVPHLRGRFGIEVNPQADHRWEDPQDDIAVDCTYEVQSSVTNVHRHEVIFAPVVYFAGSTPLTVDEWTNRWVLPMLHLASLATRRPQRLSWLTVDATPRDATGQQQRGHPSGVVFGTGIAQAPYLSDYRQEWREPGNRPLFTLATITMPLPALIRRWVDLEADDNPFIELYSQTIRRADLPARARFLYLIQALEALHGYEHAAADEEAQGTFTASRAAAIDALLKLDLPAGKFKFIRDNWSKRRPDSLDRRLRDLIVALPCRVRDLFISPPGGSVTVELMEAGEQQLEGQLRRLRNNLSHGTRNYHERELRPWVEIAEIMCRAHTLRLLGFSDEGIERGLAPPPAPNLSPHDSSEPVDEG